MKKSSILIVLTLFLFLPQNVVSSDSGSFNKNNQPNNPQQQQPKKKKGDRHAYNEPEDVARFQKIMADVEGGEKKVIRRHIADIFKKGLGNEDAYVFRIVHEKILQMKNEDLFDALASQVKKNRRSENYMAVSGALDLLRYSDNPKNWQVGDSFIDSKDNGVGILALELVGQGIRKSVPDIIKLLKREKIKSKRLTTACAVLNYFFDLSTALDPAYPLSWWETNKKSFDNSVKPRNNGVVLFHNQTRVSSGSYYGIKLEVANTFFCIDTSLSMKPDNPAVRPEKKKSYTSVEAFPKFPDDKFNGSKIWTARKELCGAIKSLSRKMSYGLIGFGGRVDAWAEAKLMPTKDKKNLISGYEWVLYDTELTLGTWMMQSVEVALRNPDTEVVFLLTDGAPIAGGSGGGNIEIKSDDPILGSKYYNDQYIQHVCYRYFQTRRVKINTILIGRDKRGEDLLSAMSEITEGTYKFAVSGNNKGNKQKKNKKNNKNQNQGNKDKNQQNTGN